jgi:hypothetical protein
VDLARHTVTMLPAPSDVSTAQIDGLYYHSGHLVAVQTGARIERVVDFPLDARGERVLGARVLERAHPLFEQPTTGVVIGDELLYIPTSQYARQGDDGTLKPRVPTRATVILRLHLPQ